MVSKIHYEIHIFREKYTNTDTLDISETINPEKILKRNTIFIHIYYSK